MRNRVATIYQMWQRGAVSPKPDNLSCQCCYYSVDLHHKLSLHTLSHALFRQDSKINSSINSSQLLLSRRKFSNKEDGDVRDSIEPNLDEIKEDSSINKRKQYRLSKIISAYVSNVTISRNEAERLIRGGFVTIAGIPITTPHFLISLEEAKHSGTKAQNTLLQIKIPNDSNADASVRNAEINRTRVWLVHKLTGELVTENDPYERPSMLQRLRQGGVSISANSSSSSTHLKPIGRLDMQTEGLILLTNNGQYAHEMEHPRNRFHRTYRVRIFGNLTESKLSAIRKGKIIIDGIRYEKMKVTIDKVQGNAKRRVRNGGRGPANIWLHVTCTEGKNRMIRRVFEHLGSKLYRCFYFVIAIFYC